MKLTTITLAMAITMAAGAAFAQNPDAIDNARSVAKSLQQKQANDTNEALDAAGVPASKPAPGAPASAVKPAVIPGAKAASASSAPSSSTPAKPAAAAKDSSVPSNKLEKVSVVQGADAVKIEISSSQAVAGQVYKMNSPARVVVELPGTMMASAQNKIPVNSAGVKGVRIGMDGKTPPTTSVVVDLESALTYDLTPAASDKLVLTLHTQGVVPVVAKTAAPTKGSIAATKAPAGQPQTVAKNSTPTAKPQVTAQPAVKSVTMAVAQPSTQPAAKSTTKTASNAKPVVAKLSPKEQVAAKVAAKADKDQSAKDKDDKDAKVAASAAIAPAADAKSADAAKPKPEDKKWAMSGKRDPFFSPVVQESGSGCSTGKKCLEIGNINLRGVVKSDTGFIAVVTNSLNKAYFLRENDPVFNGYVLKITGDSVVFQETVQDKLGKPFTREVVKRIFTPAV